MILPTFFICGAKKSGTTALYKHLDEHPEVCMSEPKETNFFYEHYEKGWEWLAAHLQNCDGKSAVGEASTMTMVAEKAPLRIAERLPEAKLIFVLRNPIERAYSQYHYYLYTGNAVTPASFHEIIRDERSALRSEMIHLGLYDEQLARFDEHFAPSQMKIILHEDLRKRTLEVVQEVYQFIGIDPAYAPSVDERHNVTQYPDSISAYYWIRQCWQPFRWTVDAWFPQTANTLRRTVRSALFSKEKPTMLPEDRAYLRDVYAEPNARLQARIGRDLSHWT